MCKARVVLGVALLCALPLFIGCATDPGMQQGEGRERDKAQATADLGRSYIVAGELRTGLRYLQEAAKLDPGDADIQRELGLVYRDLRQLDLAEKHLKRALALRPDFPAAENDLGMVYADQKRWDLALACFQRTAENLTYKTPQFAYNNMGSVHFRRGDYQRAIESYRQAIRLDPRYSDAYFNLGAAYEQLGRWEDAIVAYNHSIENDPNFPSPYFRLGSLYYELNMKREASGVLRQFLALVPDGPAADRAREMLAAIPQ